MTFSGYEEGCPNYYPNSFSGPIGNAIKYLESKFQVASKDVARFDSDDEDNFTQCGIFFRETLTKDERERLVDNMASHIINAQEFLQVLFYLVKRYFDLLIQFNFRKGLSNNLDWLMWNLARCSERGSIFTKTHLNREDQFLQKHPLTALLTISM